MMEFRDWKELRDWAMGSRENMMKLARICPVYVEKLAELIRLYGVDCQFVAITWMYIHGKVKVIDE